MSRDPMLDRLATPASPEPASSGAACAPPSYAELHCITNFTFLRGASHPQEVVERACELGYSALAITDECSVGGVVRAHMAAKDRLKLLVGSEFRLACGLRFVALAIDRRGYGRLCRLITRGRRAARKGSYSLTREDVEELGLENCFILWLPALTLPAAEKIQPDEARWLLERFAEKVRIAVELLRDGADSQRLAILTAIGHELGIPLVATGDVHMHTRERRVLQDVLAAIRLNTPVAEVGWNLLPNGERYLRERERLARLYPAELLEESVAIAAACNFSLDELRYEYPHELVPAGETPASYLRKLTEQGVLRRWSGGAPPKVRAAIESELALIADLRYEPYFLTVNDIVTFARSKGILCQGRGSAANSAVCYCLGVTAVDPNRVELLFERFISRERNEPPDIDIDFEHERREEVLQYVYTKYGRTRAALAATVIMYRPRSALRDLGKAFGLDPEQCAQLTKLLQWWDGGDAMVDITVGRGESPPAAVPFVGCSKWAERMSEAGFDPGNPMLARMLSLARELVTHPGFPRHLSQHVGGFVISEGPLEELVPIENATMPERTVVQWDKDDLNDLGLLKVDLLGLGMLTALRRAFELVNDFRGTHHALGQVPAEDPAVYDMICRADTIGVFQIESRAQMAMLPRLQPRTYYDLVIEVAIVRPGPIQGDMVHPYLQKRKEIREAAAARAARAVGDAPIAGGTQPIGTALNPADRYLTEADKVLSRTLGVPIFQEQVMQLAIVAAGFTPGEADSLRRAMGAWKRTGGLEHFKDKLLNGMRARNYSEDFAQRLYKQMMGFGEYGFPESHSASFALLAYDSSWLKHYEPAAFTCALLNSQPMGFYAPAQLVRDARDHGVEVRPVDVQESEVECTLEQRDDGEPALRLGMCLVKSLSESGARRVADARMERKFESVQDVARRCALDRGDLEALAAAGALSALSGNRHLAFWEVAGTERPLPLAPSPQRAGSIEEGRPLLQAPTEGQRIVADYASVGLTLGRHPMALLREKWRNKLLSAADLKCVANGKWVRTAGIVLMRQRPQSASGVTFVTIEDETGQVNLVVWESVGREQRKPLLASRLLEVYGQLQTEEGITHLIAQKLTDRSALLGELLTRSRDFR